MNTKAYAEGSLAFSKGKSLSENPYPEYNENWHAWGEGWTFSWGEVPLPEDAPVIPKITKASPELPKKRKGLRLG